MKNVPPKFDSSENIFMIGGDIHISFCFRCFKLDSNGSSLPVINKLYLYSVINVTFIHPLIGWTSGRFYFALRSLACCFSWSHDNSYDS